MPELSALHVRITADAGDLRAETVSAETALKGLGTEFQHVEASAARTGLAMTRMGGSMGRMTKVMQANRFAIQGVAFQAQDLAVQLAAGTRWTTAFAQQGSQIAGYFGPVGAILGALVAVTLPALGMALANAGRETVKFSDALDEAKESLEALKAVNENFTAKGLVQLKERYGEVNAELLLYIARMQQASEIRAADAALAAVEALAAEMKMVSSLSVTAKISNQQLLIMAGNLGVTRDRAREIVAAYGELKKAATLQEAQDAMVRLRELLVGTRAETTEWWQKLLDAEGAIRLVNAEGAKVNGWLSAAVAGAASFADNLWEAAKAALAARAAMPGGGQFGPGNGGGTGRGRGSVDPRQVGGSAFDIQNRGGAEFLRNWKAPTAGGGGGGGGGTSPLQGELDAILQALMSAEELELQSWERRQEVLRQALEQRLLTQQEYAARMQEAQEQHQERMAEIDAYRFGDGLQKAGQFFGDMATAFGQGNDKMVKIARAFAATEALINAWRAYSQVLADPSLPFIAKFAAAAQVLGAGLGAVNAIKGAGGGGGSGGGTSAASAPAQARSYFNVTLVGGNSFGRGEVIGLIERINEEIRNGAQIAGLRVT